MSLEKIKDEYVVTYSCETKDGASGFGEGEIICKNRNDAQAVKKTILENPERFDFAPCEEGEKRLVEFEGTEYID